MAEHPDPLGRLASGRRAAASSVAPPPATGTGLAWAARDDPQPFLALRPRLAGLLVPQFIQFRRTRARRRHKGPAGPAEEGAM